MAPVCTAARVALVTHVPVPAKSCRKTEAKVSTATCGKQSRPTAVVMRQDYHLDNASLGAALGLLGLGVALSELPWGVLTDRWGDRRVLLTGLGATAMWLFAM
ncbi:MAG: MFS transporter, partial [Mesorhizobium sp.]